MIGWKPFNYDQQVASSRYRCYLPLAELQKKSFPVEVFNPQNIPAYNAVVFSKSYTPKDIDFAAALKNQGSKVILDICDNHFYNPNNLSKYFDARNNLIKMSEYIDHVVCSTAPLAGHVKKELSLGYMPSVIGDPIEPVRKSIAHRLGLTSIQKNHFVRARKQLLWFGNHGSPNAPGGMLDILSVADILSRVNRYIPIEVNVVSNNRGKYDKHIRPLDFKTNYYDWKPRSFIKQLYSADAVIIPITRNPFTECKTNNRLAMAIAHGIPAIADSIPSYMELGAYCYLDRWEDGLIEIFSEIRAVKDKIEKGREYISLEYSISNISNMWEKFFFDQGC